MNKELQEFIDNYEICDGHAHIFPAKISEKAVESIGHFYGIDMYCESGTSEALINSGKHINVSKFLVCSTATVPQQVESINQFIASYLQQKTLQKYSKICRYMKKKKNIFHIVMII